jgi:hypothetical protein
VATKCVAVMDSTGWASTSRRSKSKSEENIQGTFMELSWKHSVDIR